MLIPRPSSFAVVNPARNGTIPPASNSAPNLNTTSSSLVFCASKDTTVFCRYKLNLYAAPALIEKGKCSFVSWNLMLGPISFNARPMVRFSMEGTFAIIPKSNMTPCAVTPAMDSFTNFTPEPNNKFLLRAIAYPAPKAVSLRATAPSPAPEGLEIVVLGISPKFK